jgi:hypothetical protein
MGGPGQAQFFKKKLKNIFGIFSIFPRIFMSL